MLINMIMHGDANDKVNEIPDEYIDCVITSIPYYGLRDYGVSGQMGLENSPEEYISNMVSLFQKIRKKLKKSGTLWLNIGDAYWTGRNHNGSAVDHENEITKKHMLRPGGENSFNYKKKDLMGMPWRVAIALQNDGWYLRSDIIWNKPNCMPESVKDRPTKSHEYIFLLTKSNKYYYDHESIKEDTSESTKERLSQDIDNQKGSNRVVNKVNGPMKAVGNINKRNKRTVWNVATSGNKVDHFAAFPEKLIEPCILAGCPIGGIVLDPFIGTGTVAKKSIELQRNYIGIELNEKYIEIINERLSSVQIKMLL